jgi:hypothetical protein
MFVCKDEDGDAIKSLLCVSCVTISNGSYLIVLEFGSRGGLELQQCIEGGFATAEHSSSIVPSAINVTFQNPISIDSDGRGTMHQGHSLKEKRMLKKRKGCANKRKLKSHTYKKFILKAV